MAAPHVTGAWAVVKQKVPSASVDDVLAVFRDSGTSINDGRFDGSVTDMRRINVDLALEQFSPNLAIDTTVKLANDAIKGGDAITYTVVVANQGRLTATGVHITDTLPMYVIGTDLNTTTTVTAGESVTYTLSATLTDGLAPGTTVTNTAYYDHASGRGESSAAFIVLMPFAYLPIVETMHINP